MKLETKRRLSMLLLAVAVIFWLLRQLAVVYIPGVSALALAGAMLLLASGMDRSRSGQKAAVTLIFAFGLLNILSPSSNCTAISAHDPGLSQFVPACLSLSQPVPVCDIFMNSLDGLFT